MRQRLVVVGWLGLTAPFCGAAEPAAGLTCEQLYASAKSAVQYRDEGYSLSQVLAAVKSVQSEGKFNLVEMETLRRAITLAYLGNASPEAIGIECRDARGTK